MRGRAGATAVLHHPASRLWRNARWCAVGGAPVRATDAETLGFALTRATPVEPSSIAPSSGGTATFFTLQGVPSRFQAAALARSLRSGAIAGRSGGTGLLRARWTRDFHGQGGLHVIRGAMIDANVWLLKLDAIAGPRAVARAALLSVHAMAHGPTPSVRCEAPASRFAGAVCPADPMPSFVSTCVERRQVTLYLTAP